MKAAHCLLSFLQTTSSLLSQIRDFLFILFISYFSKNWNKYTELWVIYSYCGFFIFIFGSVDSKNRIIFSGTESACITGLNIYMSYLKAYLFYRHLLSNSLRNHFTEIKSAKFIEPLLKSQLHLV